MGMGIQDILSAGSGGSETLSLKDLLQKQLDEATEEMAESLSRFGAAGKSASELASSTASTIAKSSSDSFGPAYRSNLMSGNFFNADSEESKYLQAARQARAISVQYKNAYDSQTFVALQQYGGINVSGTYYANENAPSKEQIEADQKRERDKVIMEKAAQEARAQREREAEALLDGTQAGEGVAADAVEGVSTPAPVASTPVEVAPVVTAAPQASVAAAVEAAAPAVSAGGKPTIKISV